MSWAAIFAILLVCVAAVHAWRSWQWRAYRREVARRLAEADRQRRNMDGFTGVIRPGAPARS